MCVCVCVRARARGLIVISILHCEVFQDKILIRNHALATPEKHNNPD